MGLNSSNLKLHKPKGKLGITTILIGSNILAYLLRYLTDISFVGTSALWAMVGVASFVYAYTNYKEYRRILRDFLVIDVFALAGMVITWNTNPLNVCVLISTQILGIMICHDIRKIKFVEFVAFFVVLYLTIRVYRVPKVLISSWQYGIILTKLVWQNTVTILIVEFLCFDYISRRNSNRHINVLLYILAMIAAIICDGMGGILTVSVFCVGVWIISRKNKLNWWKILLLGISGVVLVFRLGNWNQILTSITDDNSRFYIWNHYFACIDTINELLFGASVQENTFLFSLKNMHNTIFNWHYFYGLIPMLYFTYIIVFNFVMSIKEKNMFFLLMMGVTVLRAMTDDTTFAFMPIWTYIWVCYRVDYKKVKSKVDIIDGAKRISQ